ncbi:Uncharacterised protein [Achromobacter kerstersii]|nr:Uncharacterised protein [Achromobacter kerstersii]
MGVGRVDISDVDLAGGNQRAVFGNRTVSLASQNGDVVGANDGDHDLTGGAISRRNGEGLGQGLARAQALNGRVVVGQVIRPLAIGVDGERAVLTGCIRLDLEHGFARVRISDIQLAANRRRHVFCNGALVIARLSGGDDGAVVGAVDRHRDLLLRHAAVAVVDRDSEGFGGSFSSLQRLDVGVGAIQVVGPLAGVVDREVAVLALAIVVYGPSVRIGGVDVGLRQLAGGAQRGAFGNGAGGFARDDGSVVGAVDGDNNLAGGAVCCRDNEGLGQFFADGQGLDLGIFIIQGVGPRPILANGERAMIARRVACLEFSLACVRIGDFQLAAGRERPVFGDRALVIAGLSRIDGRAVVRAVDGDRDLLVDDSAVAVVDGHGEGFGDRFARFQTLNGLVGVVEVVGPVARTINRERTIRTLAIIVDGPRMGVGRVDISDVDLAGGNQRAVFGDRAVSLTGQHRSVVGANDRDDHLTCRAIRRRNGERLGQGLASAQALNSGVVIGQGVVPLAIGVDGEGAVLTGCIGLRLEDRLARIRIGHFELAAGRERPVFGDRTLVIAGLSRIDGRAVVRAVDGDRDLLVDDSAVAVVDGHGEGFGKGLAGLQALNSLVGVVQVVGPVAGAVDRERAIRALAVIVDGPGMGIGCVNVSDVDLAGGNQGAVFGDRAVSLASQNGDVIRTNDGDNHLTGGAISRRDRKGLGQRFARAQALDSRVVIGQGVVPLAIGIDGEGAVLTGCIGLRLEDRLARIRVGHFQLAAGRERTVFGDRTLVIAGLSRVDDGAVIGAIDGDCDLLVDDSAVAVVHLHGKRFGKGLAGLQTLNGLVGVVEVVRPVAGAVDGEGTIRTLAVIVDGPGMGIGGINISNINLAGSNQRAVFRNRAVSLAGQNRNIIRTDDRDHDQARRAISRRDGEGLGQGLASAQALNSRVIVGQVIRPLAIGVDGEGAVLTGCIGLRLEDRLARIRVGHFQLAAGRERTVFGDRTLVIAGLSRIDGRAVVRAVDGDRDRLVDDSAVAVVHRHGESFGDRFAGLQTLNGLVGVVEVVGPVARPIDGERTIRTLTIIVDGPGMGIGGINISNINLAGSNQGAVFGDRAVSLARQNRDVIRTDDRDHDLARRAISRRNGEGLGQGLASAQALNCRVIVGQGVVPLAIGVDGERAVLTGCIGLRLEDRLTCIRIGHFQLAAGRERTVFGDRTLVIAGLSRVDDGAVIGAIDGDCDLLVDDSAVAVVDSHGKRFGKGLAGLQALNSLVGVVQVVGPVAEAVDGEGTICTLAVIVDGPSVRIGRVNVSDVDFAGSNQGAVFGDRAVSLTGQHRSVVGANDRDDHLTGGAIRRRNGERLGQRLARAQTLNGGVAIVQVIRPLAVRIDRERAVCGGGAGLNLEHGLAGVWVGDVQLAADGQSHIFGDGALVCARDARGDNGAVIRAVDRDRDLLRRDAAVAVVDRDGEGLSDRFAALQALDGGVAVVQVVGPLAGVVDREAAKVALAAVVDRPGVCVVCVDVGLGQLAGDVGGAAVSDGTGGLAADDRRVVGAVDGDRDGLRGHAAVAVVDGDGERLGQRFADAQCLHLGISIVQVVGPLAGVVDREVAVVAVAAVVDRPRVRVVRVYVGLAQLAAHRQRAVFFDGTRGFSADDGHVIGAVDGDRDGLRGHAAVAVVDRDGEGFGQRLACAQRLHGRVGVGQVVGPGAVGGNGQRAVLAGAIVVDGPRVRVGRVDVSHIKLAGGGEGGFFGDGAGGLAAERGHVVRALDGDGDRAGGAVCRGDGEGLGQRFADGQRLHAGVVVVQVVDPRAAGVDRECAVLASLAGLHDEAGFAVVHVGDVELAVCSEGGVFLDCTGVIARVGGGDLGRVVHADDRDFDRGGRRCAAGIGDGVGNRGGGGLAGRQVLKARARRERVAAVRQDGERAAIGAGDGNAAGGHGAAADGDDRQGIAIRVGVVGEQVAALDGILVAAADVVQGGRRGVGCGRRGRIVGVVAGGARRRGAGQGVVAAAGVGIGQVQRSRGFQDAGQAHEAAAAGIAAAGHDGGGGVQFVEGVAPGLQRSQQAVGIGAGGRRDGRFARIGQRAGEVLVDGDLAAFTDHDRHAVFNLKGNRGARGRDDVTAGRDFAALMQFSQRAVAIAYPRAAGNFIDNCGGGKGGHVGSVSGSYPKMAKY